MYNRLTGVQAGGFDPDDERGWRAVARELTIALPQLNGVVFIGLDLQAKIYY